jgi:hypothetical protein
MAANANGDLLRELAARRAGTGRHALPGETENVTLLPGRLPDNLPVRLTVEGSDRLIGSVASQVEGQPAGWDIVLDTNRPVAEVVAGYERVFNEQGWQPLTQHPLFPVERGFRAAPPPGMPDLSALPTALREQMARMQAFRPEQRIFCAPVGTGTLTLDVRPRPSAPTDVLIRLDVGKRSLCAMAQQMESSVIDRMPALIAPQGIRLTPHGGGGSDEEWTSQARAVTDERAADLAAHFAAQLEAAGWIRQAAGAAEPVAWSTWTVPGNPEGYGFLYVLEKPGTSRRDLYVEITASTDPAAGTGGGWGYTRPHFRPPAVSVGDTGLTPRPSADPEPPPEQS